MVGWGEGWEGMRMSRMSSDCKVGRGGGRLGGIRMSGMSTVGRMGVVRGGMGVNGMRADVSIGERMGRDEDEC
jgi:hypothetical protein